MIQIKDSQMTTPMWTRLYDHLKVHEGYSSTAYQDHLGNWTIGYGRRLDGDKGITEDEANFLLHTDVETAYKQMHSSIRIPSDTGEVREAALIAMIFQLGIGTFLKFKKTIAAIESSDWDKAAVECLDSLWAKQTPKRADAVSKILRTGVWHD